MLYDPSRHEPLHATAWDVDRVHDTIARIVQDVEARFMPDLYWPPHPLDLEKDDPPDQPFTPLYFGACGVVWALHYLQDRGAAQLSRNYLPYLDGIQQRNRAWLGENADKNRGSYLMGDTPYALLAYATNPGRPELADAVATLIEANLNHPSRELMLGSPGTLLAALLMHEQSGEARWAELFRRTARTLWSSLLWSPQRRCHYWTQELEGKQYSFIDGIHGFVATASPLIKGRHLMSVAEWSAWEQCIISTTSCTASCDEEQVNWHCELLPTKDSAPPILMQFCHGAPGFITCLAGIPSRDLDSLLLRAGETVWTSGPVNKGSNLCHGTGGNGYALLKLYQRTGDNVWLKRARAFAMHGIAQTHADALRFGQHRYSLWTGDLGFAIYLRDCLQGTAAFPTLDTFFAPKSETVSA